MWPDPRKTADLVTFTEEILNGKLHFLCSVFCILKANCLILPLLWIYHILLTIHYKYKRNGNEELFANLLIILLFCPGATVRYWERCSVLISLCTLWHQFCCVLNEVKWYTPVLKEYFRESYFLKNNIYRYTMVSLFFSLFFSFHYYSSVNRIQWEYSSFAHFFVWKTWDLLMWGMYYVL